MRKYPNIKFISILIGFVLSISCTPQKKYEILSFFFDGVPEPTITDIVETTDSTTISNSNRVVVSEKAPTEFIHVPYLEKNCESCHDQERVGQLVEQQPNLCYICHENFNNSFDKLHGPVQAGYCTSCHLPHRSKYSKLLVKAGQNLCFECHDQEIISEGKIHKDIGNASCTSCHDPHGGINTNLMAKGTCLNCHNDYKNQFEYVHGPVAAGFCNTCHDSHNSQKENLLLRQNQDVCLYCHDKNIVMNNENHQGTEGISCMECHNPHGGDDRYYFN